MFFHGTLNRTESAEVSCLKILVVGDTCGKTSLVQRYVNNEFPAGSEITIGASCTTKNINFSTDDKSTNYSLRIWDINSYTPHQHLINPFFDNAEVIILCKDLTNSKTPDDWHKICLAHSVNVPIILVGTKCDGDIPGNSEQVTLQKYAEKIKAKFYICCSAKTGENVAVVFDKAIRLAIEFKNELRVKNESLQLSLQKN